MTEDALEQELANLAVSQGLVSAEQLRDAQRLQEEREAKGERPELGKLLVEMELVEAGPLARLRRLVARAGAETSPGSGSEDAGRVHVLTQSDRIKRPSVGELQRSGTGVLRCTGCKKRYKVRSRPDKKRKCPRCKAPLELMEGEDPLLGATLAGFKVRKRIGEGGMGNLYRATQLSIKRDVAVKVLKPELVEDSSYVKRFEREARAVAGVSHENIISVIDAGEADDCYYFAMQFVRGLPLDQVKLPLEEARALAIGRQVAEALVYLEPRGLVHRDVKPGNLILEAETELVKLADFGLARPSGAQGAARVTQTGVAVGTPCYMSPEQVRAEDAIDAKTDIYSLGATLYELLTGDVPYDGSTAAVIMAKHLNEKVPDLRKSNPQISSATAKLVRRMMAKEAKDRPSAKQVLEEIRRLEEPAGGGVLDAWVRRSRPSGTPPGLARAIPFPVVVGVPLAAVLFGALAAFLATERPERDGTDQRPPPRETGKADPAPATSEGVTSPGPTPAPPLLPSTDPTPTPPESVTPESGAPESGTPEPGGVGPVIPSGATPREPPDLSDEDVLAEIRREANEMRKAALQEHIAQIQTRLEAASTLPDFETARQTLTERARPLAHEPQSKAQLDQIEEEIDERRSAFFDAALRRVQALIDAQFFRLAQWQVMSLKLQGLRDREEIQLRDFEALARAKQRVWVQRRRLDVLKAERGVDVPTGPFVRAGLQWLLWHQQQDGSWSAQAWSGQCDVKARCSGPGSGPGDSRYAIGVTALALRAIVVGGQTHREGVLAERIDRGLRWIMEQQKPDGSIGFDRGETMYNHALATILLCDLLARTRDPSLKEAAERAVGFCVQAQNPGQGWKYGVRTGRNDTSMTGWMVRALVAAQAAGIEIQEVAFRGARDWFVHVTDSLGSAGYSTPGGGSAFLPQNDGQYESLPTMTAVSVACQLEIARILPNLLDQGVVAPGLIALIESLPPGWNDRRKANFYYWHYATLAMRLAHNGRLRQRWDRSLRRTLLSGQRIDGCADGSWDPIGEWCLAGGRVYGTALNVQTLQILAGLDDAQADAPNKRKKKAEAKPPPEADEPARIRSLRAKVAQGKVSSMISLAKALEKGFKLASGLRYQNLAEAAHWYRKAVEQGSHAAKIRLRVLLAEHGDLRMPLDDALLGRAVGTPSLVFPEAGQQLSVLPREITFTWKPVPAAGPVTYMIEVEYSNTQRKKWWPYRKVSGLGQPTYHLERFPGSQPGRWRVRATSTSGGEGDPSGWREFELVR